MDLMVSVSEFTYLLFTVTKNSSQSAASNFISFMLINNSNQNGVHYSINCTLRKISSQSTVSNSFSFTLINNSNHSSVHYIIDFTLTKISSQSVVSNSINSR